MIAAPETPPAGRWTVIAADGEPVGRRGDLTATEARPRAVRSIIASIYADAGVEGRISGHSLRAGAARSLAAAGGPPSWTCRLPDGVSRPVCPPITHATRLPAVGS